MKDIDGLLLDISRFTIVPTESVLSKSSHSYVAVALWMKSSQESSSSESDSEEEREKKAKGKKSVKKPSAKAKKGGARPRVVQRGNARNATVYQWQYDRKK